VRAPALPIPCPLGHAAPRERRGRLAAPLDTRRFIGVTSVFSVVEQPFSNARVSWSSRVFLGGNETLGRPGHGTNAARGTAIFPIAPWSVPNQIWRVALSNVM